MQNMEFRGIEKEKLLLMYRSPTWHEEEEDVLFDHKKGLCVHVLLQLQ